MAELGYELAQHNAAFLIRENLDEVVQSEIFGDGDPMVVVLTLLQRSADQAQLDSMVEVADFNYDGVATPVDQAEAMRLYRAAGEAGSARALFNIGWAHQTGSALPLDLNIALRYYDMALATDAEAHTPVGIARVGLRVQMIVKQWTGVDLLQALVWGVNTFLRTHGDPESVGSMLP